MAHRDEQVRLEFSVDIVGVLRTWMGERPRPRTTRMTPFRTLQKVAARSGKTRGSFQVIPR